MTQHYKTFVSVQSINQFIRHNQTHKYKIIMTTYRTLLYGVTGSTQGADAPLIRATHVLKTYVNMCSIIHKKKHPKKKKKHNSEYIIMKQS